VYGIKKNLEREAWPENKREERAAIYADQRAETGKKGSGERTRRQRSEGTEWEATGGGPGKKKSAPVRQKSTSRKFRAKKKIKRSKEAAPQEKARRGRQ